MVGWGFVMGIVFGFEFFGGVGCKGCLGCEILVSGFV